MSEVYVEVLYDFKYYTEDGSEIKIKAGEELLLLRKSNENWWQVIRSSEENPFYAPSNYLTIVGLKCKESSESIDVNSNFTDDNYQKDSIKKVSKPKLSKFFKNTIEEIKLRNVDVGHQPVKDGLAFKNPLCTDEFSTSNFEKEKGEDIPLHNELTIRKSPDFLNPKSFDKSIEQVTIFSCIYPCIFIVCIAWE